MSADPIIPVAPREAADKVEIVSETFSSIATDAKGVIQIFNIGAAVRDVTEHNNPELALQAKNAELGAANKEREGQHHECG